MKSAEDLNSKEHKSEKIGGRCLFRQMMFIFVKNGILFFEKKTFMVIETPFPCNGIL